MQLFLPFACRYADSVAKAIIRSFTSDIDFKDQFQDIATILQPAANLFRKAVVSVKKDKKLFSPEQLTKVVTLLMSNLPYILFWPKSEMKDYAGCFKSHARFLI